MGIASYFLQVALLKMCECAICLVAWMKSLGNDDVSFVRVQVRDGKVDEKQKITKDHFDRFCDIYCTVTL